MKSPTTLTRSIAVAVVAALSSFGAASAASATPTADVHKLSGSAESIRDFWTTKRMSTAEPVPLPVGARGTRRSSRPPAGTTAASREGAERLPRASGGAKRPARKRASASFAGLELPWDSSTRYGYAPAIPAVGRLWFTSGGGRFGCTATAVARNIVVTAAHCVRDGRTGAWNTKFVFIPGVNGSSQPYGSFAGRTAIAPSRWASPNWLQGPGTGGWGYYAQDFAFVVLHPNRSGRHVGSYTGSFGMLANAPHGGIYHLGYPYEGRWGACTASNCKPWHVASVPQRYGQYAGSKYDVGMSGYTTGGSSGGPWFQQWNGKWYISSVQSHMGVPYTDETGGRHGFSHYGPYFDNDTLSIFRYAQTQ